MVINNGINGVDKKKSLSLSVLSNSGQFDIVQLVDRVIERFGRHQILVFLLLCTNSIIVAINHTLTTFHIYTPAEYHCASAPLVAASVNNATCSDGCQTYEFLDNDTSVVTEWSLVCDRRYLSALLNTIYFVGVTMGSLVCGALADMWGRRKLILACLYLQGIFGTSLYLASNLEMFMVLRLIQGFFIQGLQGCSYTLLQELCPPKKRTFCGFTWEIFWGFGMVMLGIIAFFIRDWRALQLALAVPTLITLGWTWIFPESPRWYLAKNRKRQAFDGVVKIAEKNNDEDFFREYNTMQLDTYEGGQKVSEAVPLNQSNEEPHESATMLDLFRNKILRKHTLVMIAVWWSVTLSYYGILLYLPNLPGGRHLNFVISAFIEIAAYILAYFALSSPLGRRYSMISYQYLNSAFCLCIGLLTFVEGDYAWKNWLIIVLALVGKGFAVSGFGGMFIYGSELFPTATRGSALGLCGFFARVGSLMAPQIILLGEKTHPLVPMAIMSVALFIGGTATFSVPETLNKKLPNTLKEVDRMWG